MRRTLFKSQSQPLIQRTLLKTLTLSDTKKPHAELNVHGNSRNGGNRTKDS